MKSVIWLLACLALVGCGSRPWDTRTVDSSGDVSSELATAVRRALEAKRAEEGRLVQYGVEKQRLVSRLMPIDTTVDWTDVPAIEDFVSGRDAEAAKNLCVVLELERHALDRKRRLGEAIALGRHWLEAGRLYRISGAEATHAEEQGVELFVAIEQLKDLVAASPPEPPLRKIDGRSLKRELAGMAVQEREREEAVSRAEDRERLEAALRNQLSQERDRTEGLRVELAGLRQQHQRLQDEHRQSQLAASDAKRQIAALETELAQRDAGTGESPIQPVQGPRGLEAAADGAVRVLGVFEWVSVRATVVTSRSGIALAAGSRLVNSGRVDHE